ncbi:MAG: YabP/YqfC family sporulation protein [Acutalibacteraceae bacterium]
MKERGFSKKVEQVLEIPDGAISGEVRMEFSGNRQVIIEGCCGILQYEEELIRLHTRSGELRFCGSALKMGCLSEDGAVISGRILSMEFLS